MRQWTKTGFTVCMGWMLLSCTTKTDNHLKTNLTGINEMDTITSKYRQATFGAGCFWCVEAIFQQLEGVVKVESGYAGGKVSSPTYREVCSGETGHAEVIRVYYDPTKVDFETLLAVFWQTHDPTTLNRQGADEGTQYRSVIFYHDEEQKKLAEKYKAELDSSGAFSNPIVTEISPVKNYYTAEAYHQNYYNRNDDEGYCRVVIAPKLEKFKKVFKDKLKQ